MGDYRLGYVEMEYYLKDIVIFILECSVDMETNNRD